MFNNYNLPFPDQPSISNHLKKRNLHISNMKKGTVEPRFSTQASLKKQPALAGLTDSIKNIYWTAHTPTGTAAHDIGMIPTSQKVMQWTVCK
jgi:hypothetical protein